MHNGVHLGTYFLIILYPFAGLFIIEMICRAAKIPSWVKLLTQATMCVGFGIVYLTMQVAHWLTGGVLLALAFALFYSGKTFKLKSRKGTLLITKFVQNFFENALTPNPLISLYTILAKSFALI